MQKVYTSGNNKDLLLGVHSEEHNVTRPELVVFERELDIVQVCTGDEFSVALTRMNKQLFNKIGDGDVYIWGDFSEELYKKPTRIDFHGHKIKKVFILYPH